MDAYLDVHREAAHRASFNIDNLDSLVEQYSGFWLKELPFVNCSCRAHQVSFG